MDDNEWNDFSMATPLETFVTALREAIQVLKKTTGFTRLKHAERVYELFYDSFNELEMYFGCTKALVLLPINQKHGYAEALQKADRRQRRRRYSSLATEDTDVYRPDSFQFQESTSLLRLIANGAENYDYFSLSEASMLISALYLANRELGLPFFVPVSSSEEHRTRVPRLIGAHGGKEFESLVPPRGYLHGSVPFYMQELDRMFADKVQDTTGK